jgi:hypothetical protein
MPHLQPQPQGHHHEKDPHHLDLPVLLLPLPSILLRHSSRRAFSLQTRFSLLYSLLQSPDRLEFLLGRLGLPHFASRKCYAILLRSKPVPRASAAYNLLRQSPFAPPDGLTVWLHYLCSAQATQTTQYFRLRHALCTTCLPASERSEIDIDLA